MQHELSQQELALVFEMLRQLALQNHNFRLPDDQSTGKLRGLAILLNLLAVKLRQFANVAADDRFMIGILELQSDFTILTAGHESVTVFGYPSAMLEQRPLQGIVAASSHYELKMLQPILRTPVSGYYSQLNFVDYNRIVIAAFCCFRTAGDKINLQVVLPKLSAANITPSKLYRDIVAETGGRYVNDAQLLQNIYDYICNHLDEPLPSNKQLARMFYTNRQKLKELFRYVLHTSVYQFYNTARLEKAHQLIEGTRLPLHDIATLCGFSSFQHFSALFSRHFGYRPGALRGKL